VELGKKLAGPLASVVAGDASYKGDNASTKNLLKLIKNKRL
jgi:hypothetical protein